MTASPTPPDIFSGLESKPKRQRVKTEKPPAKSKAVREAYEYSFFARYGVNPLTNAKTNALYCKLVDQVEEDLAVKIVKHYLLSDSDFFVKNKHTIGICISCADKLSTEVKLLELKTQNKQKEGTGYAD